MIEIKNLSHIYTTKSKNKVLALNGVSCKLADTGMYFIVGKSGSGKSTLLNLVGGLDRVTDGDIVVDGVSMKGFASKDYDAYRANYVGIIFQEFNLLEELTVFQNIELQLNIAGIKATPEMIDNSLNKVGLNDYGKRLPYELSGGERQRVAIARQLAKGVKLLLADEPTGNLDSENGENVINILKELSKELTVVVVSHDMDFASRYADCIITIKDGKIEHISDDCQLTTNSERLPYKSVKPHFPFKFVRKFAAKNIFKKKIRFIIAAFLSIISFALFSVLGSILTVDPERSLSEQLIADEPNTYIAYQAYYADNDANEENILQFFGDKELENEYIEAFNGEYDIPYFNIYKGDRNSTIGLISSAEDIKNILGYELLDGYLPLDEDSAYITDYYAKLMIARKRQYIEDGVQKTFEKDAVFNDFIGKKIVISGDSVGSSVSYFTIAGIIITDYDTYEYPELNPENMNSQVGNSNEYSVSGKKRDDIYNVCYFNYEGMRKRMADNVLASIQNQFTVVNSDGENFNGLNIKKHSSIWVSAYTNYKILTADNVYTVAKQKEFNNNEIILPLSYYNIIFNENDLYNQYIDTVDTTSPTFPKHIGESIILNLKNEDGIIDTREFVFGGLIISSSNVAVESMPLIYVGEQNYSDYAMIMNAKLMRIALAAEFNNDELLEFLRMSMEHKVVVESQYTQAMYMKEIEIKAMNNFYLAVGSAFLLISLMMFASYIASTISDKKKEIGIIRAIGGTSRSVFNIFYMLGLIFSCVVSLLSIIAYCIALPLLNGSFANGVLQNTQLLYINPLAIGAIVVLSFVVMTVASVIPIIKVSLKSPMQTIRQV